MSSWAKLELESGEVEDAKLVEDVTVARSLHFPEMGTRRWPCRRCALVSTAVCLLIILSFGCGRSSKRFPVDEAASLPHDWTALHLDPFDLVLDVKNKREVIDKRAGYFGGIVNKFMSDEDFMKMVLDQIVGQLPDLMSARGFQVAVSLHYARGLRAAITFRVTGYDANYLCTQRFLPSCGEFFTRLIQVPNSLSTLMNDTSYKTMFDEHVQDNLREGLLERLPKKAMARLQEEGLLASVFTEPQAIAWVEEELTTKKDVVLHAEISSRQKVVEAAKEYVGSWLGMTEAAVNSLSHARLMAKVRSTVELEMHQRLEQELAGTMGFVVEMLDEADAGSADEKRTFWVHVKVTAIDLISTFHRQMPPGFAGNVSLMMDMMEQLAKLGLTEMKSSKTSFYNRLFDGFASVLQDKLQKALRQEIGAEVWNSSKEGLEAFQEYIASGRCCASKQDDGDKVFWVSKAVLRKQTGTDGRAVSCPLLGCNEALRCPPVAAPRSKAACALAGEAVEPTKPAAAMETAYQPPEECLELQGVQVNRRTRVDTVMNACQEAD